MQTVTHKSYPALAAILQRTKRIGVLLSGGCDSEVLLRAAADVLGTSNTIAFNAVTPFITSYYTDIVTATTNELNIKLVRQELDPMQADGIKANTSQRCYHCKKAIYSTIIEAATRHNITILADGTNLDDTHEHRPGMKAAEELHISHPFITANMTKADIRQLGKLLNMPDPDRPSDSCLATRIPENTPITAELLLLIEKIEQPLRAKVKGRLRARVSETQITLEFQTVDNMLIKTHEKELRTTAETSKHSIRFHENT